MGLSIEELQLQATEYLPAREVMTGLGGCGGSCPNFQNNEGGVINVGLNVNDVLNKNSILNVLSGGYGHDNDGVDIV
jgi:hypothetical protein